jgi:protein TonB
LDFPPTEFAISGVSFLIVPRIRTKEESMFAESLLESAPHAHYRSGWTKVASAVVQSAALAVLLAIPLLHVERLQVVPPVPSIRMTRYETPVPTQAQTAPRTSSAAPFPRQMIEPTSIPSTIARFRGAGAEPAAPDLGSSCIGSCGAGIAVATILNSSGPTIDIRPPHRPAPPPVVSTIQLGDVIRKVLPEYPAIAKQLHMQGAVVLMALVGKDGRVERVQPISGPPMLIDPAKRAVEQWQYRPYILNHEPIEVQTQITVNFVLNRD